jgi:hypothetical protein
LVPTLQANEISKFMNATSVGFMPTEEPKRILDENNSWSGGYEFTNQELLELSTVAIPANEEALARSMTRAVSEGVITREAEREATKSFLDAFLNPSWSQSVPGVTYAVEEPLTPKKEELASPADYIGVAYNLGKLAHAAERLEFAVREARGVATPEDLERVLGIRAHGDVASVQDLERLFRLGS